jgi:hypothetical protein
MELGHCEPSPAHLTDCAFAEDLGDPTTIGKELHEAIWHSEAAGDARLYEAGLAYLARLRGEIDVIERELVTDARTQRFTWEQIGRWLRTSRQGAYNRFGGADDAVDGRARNARSPRTMRRRVGLIVGIVLLASGASFLTLRAPSPPPFTGKTVLQGGTATHPRVYVVSAQTGKVLKTPPLQSTRG